MYLSLASHCSVALLCLLGRSPDPLVEQVLHYLCSPTSPVSTWKDRALYLYIVVLLNNHILHRNFILFFTSVASAWNHFFCWYFLNNQPLKIEYRCCLFKEGFFGSPRLYSSVFRKIVTIKRKEYKVLYPAKLCLSIMSADKQYLTCKNTGDIKETVRKQL